MLQQLLKEIQQTNALLSGPTSFDRGVYEDWQNQAFARSMSQAGGIGLADMVYRQLTAGQANTSAGVKPPGGDGGSHRA